MRERETERERGVYIDWIHGADFLSISHCGEPSFLEIRLL